MNMQKNFIKDIFKYSIKEKKDLFLIIVIPLIISIIGIIEPFITSSEYQAITLLETDKIIKYALIILVIKMSEMVLQSFNSLASNRFTRRVNLKLQRDVTEELYKLEQANFDKAGTNFFVSRVNDDATSILSQLGNFKQIIFDIISNMGVVIYIINSSFKIFMLIMLFSIIFFLLDMKKRKIYEQRYKNRRFSRERQVDTFNETIRGIKDIKGLNIRNNITNYVIKGQERISEINYQETRERESFNVIYYGLKDVSEFLVILYSVYLYLNNQLPGSLILIILMYRRRIDWLIGDIQSLYMGIKDIKLYQNNINEILDGVKYPKEKYGEISKEHFTGDIVFNNVCFGYDKEKPVINHLSFKINPRETIGIVGRSGAGKSTIFNLMDKLYRPLSGEILYDNENIDNYDEETLRSNITVINQNPYLFNMSIKDNIMIVNPEASFEEIINCCKQAKLDKYIESLPDKYDTLIGENGLILSGGLKQRLAIARALVKKTDIILFDEATSSLDNEIQEEIMNTIKAISNEYTILIIAHRLSTIKECDRIMVIDNGSMVGFDTHNKLIKNNKLYQKLYEKELIKE